MARNDEEDALRWEGDDEPTSRDTPSTDRAEAVDVDEPDAGRPTPSAPGHADADSIDERRLSTDPDTHEVPDSRTDDEGPVLGNVSLVALGVIGGLDLLWSVGWLLGGMRLRERIELLTASVADVMLQAGSWLAVAAPALWFVSCWVLTRRAPLWQRFAWLAAGVIVLVPWPFVMVGVIG